MQVESFLQDRARFAVFILLSGVVLVPTIACRRSPAPDVVATVNGRDILRSELDRQYQIVKISQGESSQEPSPEQAEMTRLAILRQMIDDEILQETATKLNVAASDEDVNAALTEKKLPYTQEEFDKQLKDHNETLDDFKRDLRHSLTVKKLMNKEVDSKINITDAEITEFYSAHKAEFNKLEPSYNLARIVVSNVPSPQVNNLQNNKASSEADARGKIQALYQKLENGEDFGVLAMNFSEDKDTASNGGDMGFVTDSDLHQAASQDVYDAISKLKQGQFTGVLPLNGGPTPTRKPVGYAVYKLLSKDEAGQRQLNDVRVQQGIRQSLREGHAQLLRTAYLEVLRDDAKVHNYYADQIWKDGAK